MDRVKRQDGSMTDRLGAVGPLAAQRALTAELQALPASQVLNRVLNLPRPEAFVQAMPAEDLYWLVKKVGEEDSVALLGLASAEQWQYVLDLEIWERDRMPPRTVAAWIWRLHLADPARLAQWFLSAGRPLVYHYLFKEVEVLVRQEDEGEPLPDGYFTLDGVFFLRARAREMQPVVEELAAEMAALDYQAYYALLEGLQGILPDELEEDIYRMRNVRLAEHGFIPFEEALAAYSPLEATSLTGVPADAAETTVQVEEDMRALVPVIPLTCAGGRNLLARAAADIGDDVVLDRLRLEFAGLCNQLIAAEGQPVRDLETLIRTAHKAAAGINLGLETICGRNRREAAEAVRMQPLLSLFRVGAGLVLKVKWECERWLKGTWFVRRRLEPEFWGDLWGGTLTGLMARRAQFFTGGSETENYRPFEWGVELAAAMETLRRVMVLDSLLEKLDASYGISDSYLHRPEITFRQPLFSLWGRDVLGLAPVCGALTVGEARALLARLRGSDVAPPYLMAGARERFRSFFMDATRESEAEARILLETTLDLVWQDFAADYEAVALKDLEGQYAGVLEIREDAGRVV